MRQSPRSARVARKAVGGGGGIDLFSALPVSVRRLPRAHRLSKRATQRLTWLDYRKTHTVTQTCRHYDIPRSTPHRWQKRFNPANLASLEDRSSRPQTVRQRTWGARAVEAALALRTQYPRWGMVGRILRSPRQRRLLVEPRPARAIARARPARPHARRKASGVPITKERPGALVEIDTMPLSPLPGLVRSHLAAVDVVSRYGVIGVRGVATAGTARQPLTAVRARCPFPITAIQIDGGSEFMAEFEAGCQAEGIALRVLPPHGPKLNGQVERMHRTFREEWWECYQGGTDVRNMQRAGREGEAVYNAIRPHQALGMRTPTKAARRRWMTWGRGYRDLAL